jgi:CheY-like chemotaxis protein
VLVIDDDPVGAAALRTLLELDGYEVVALQSATEAIALLRRERFDAVITDLEMPNAHGVDVVRAARAVAGNIPVLVVTGYGRSVASERALAMGAQRVFDKPLQYEALADELARHLRRPPLH